MPFFSQLQRLLFVLYALCIAIGIGSMICAGALSAPSIFRAPLVVEGLEMSLFQSGVLMTSIFVKLNFLLNFIALLIGLVEIPKLITKKALLSPLLGLLSIGLILAFSFYYTPLIIQAQQIGELATQSDAFDALHHQSVLVFQILIGTLIAFFVLRIYPLIRF